MECISAFFFLVCLFHYKFLVFETMSKRKSDFRPTNNNKKVKKQKNIDDSLTKLVRFLGPNFEKEIQQWNYLRDIEPFPTIGIREQQVKLKCEKILEENDCIGILHLIVGLLTSDPSRRPFVDFIKHQNTEFGYFFCNRDLLLSIANTQLGKVCMKKYNYLEAKKHFYKALEYHPCGRTKNTLFNCLRNYFPCDEQTNLLKGFKQNFCLKKTTFTGMLHFYICLNPALQCYVKKKYSESYFALKYFVEQRKQWISVYVLPFGDEDWPKSITEELFLILFPKF